MSYADTILPEFDQEMASTRKVLERVPDDKLDWKAHPKSQSIGWNAGHLANIPTWATITLTQSSFDLAPPGQPPPRAEPLKSRAEILATFDKNVAEARQALAAASNEEFAQPWSLKKGGQTMFTLPRSAVIRTFVLSHMIHHRAHLLVYLRLNDIPVPGMYGPSADE
jgi:uncharacterized damage-inducible protein DinB